MPRAYERTGETCSWKSLAPTNLCVPSPLIKVRLCLKAASCGLCRNTGWNPLQPDPALQGAAALQAALSAELASLGHKRMVRLQQQPQRGAGRR